MGLLAFGVAIWSLTHLFPALLPDSRDRLIARLGEKPYRGLFSLVIIASLVLIVIGWKSASSALLYPAPLSSGPLMSLLVLVGLILFFASQVPGNIRRHVRHPQMTATLFWAAAHLLSNGEVRSIILFGGFAIWAAAEVAAINRRDGTWQKPPPAALGKDAVAVVLGTLAFTAIAYFHGTLFGVTVLPG